MNTALAHRDTGSPFAEAVSAPRIMQKVHERTADCPVHVAQQAARAELMLLRNVTSPAEYVRRLGVDTIEAADNVLAWIRRKWAEADCGVIGRGRQLAALDLASNEIMLRMVFGSTHGGRRDDLQRQHAANRQRRAALLDQSPRLRVSTVTTPARITLASRRFRRVTAQLDRLTIAAELMIERQEIIEADGQGNLGIVRIRYVPEEYIAACIS